MNGMYNIFRHERERKKYWLKEETTMPSRQIAAPHGGEKRLLWGLPA